MITSHTDDKAKKDYVANPTQLHFILFTHVETCAVLLSLCQLLQFLYTSTFSHCYKRYAYYSLIFQPHKDSKISIISTR